MKAWFSKFWKEVIFFSILLVYYLYGLSPDMTWLSIGADQASYVAAAQYGTAPGLGGYGLYITLGSILMHLPGNPFWLLGLLSALSAVGTCIVIYLIVRRLSGSVWASYVGALVFASSFVVWSESIIVETYLLTVLVASLTIYFAITKRFYWMGVMQALSLGLHPLSIFATMPCMVYMWLDTKDPKYWLKVVGVTSLGLLWYLRSFFYSDVTTNQFFLDDPFTTLVNGLGGYFGLAVIPVSTTLERFYEVFTVFSVSLWTIPFIVLAVLKKSKETWLLLAVAVLSWAFFNLSVFPQWIKYMVMPMLPLSILTGIGISRLKEVYYLKPVVIVVCLIFMVLNITYYSPGKTIDNGETTTMRAYYESLNSLPDNSLVVNYTWGHTGVVQYYYCVLNEDRIDFINWDAMTTKSVDRTAYKEYQRSKGIVYPVILDNGGKLSVEDFANQLQILNPEREVYVSYVKSSEIPMEFSFISADEFNIGLNNIPESKVDYVGGE